MDTRMLAHPDLTTAWLRHQDHLDRAAAAHALNADAPARRPVRAAVGGWLVRLGERIAGAAMAAMPVTPLPAGAKMGGER